MSAYKEMKIEINKTQTLQKVVKALEKLGFKKDGFDNLAKCATTYSDGTYCTWRFDIKRCTFHDQLVTLKDLEKMCSEVGKQW